MLIGRSIFALVLSLAMVVAMAPANAAHCSAADADSHDCCKKQKPCESPSHKGKCSGDTCAMQCCRVIPAPPDAVTQPVAGTLTNQVADLPPPTLHSLMDPEAIYHPPRA